jgi:coenzyme PQQ synthesis protein D (PqqD)
MYPKAREDGLRVREVGGQFAVFDEKAERLHILNETAAIVWRHCDGLHSSAELAQLVAVETSSTPDEQVALAALDQLAEADLLETPSEAPTDGISRRALLRGAAGLAVGAAVPAVISLGLTAGSARAHDAKVQVCHRGRTIWVSKEALPAHLAHGDTLGPCGATTTTSPPTTTGTTTPRPTTTTEVPTTSPAPTTTPPAPPTTAAP